MEIFNKDIEAHYSFSLNNYDGDSHDYFLHCFKPDLANFYFQGKLFKKQKLKAEIFIAVHEDLHSYSLSESPFGGFWTNESLSSQALSFFIEELKIALKEKGIKSLTVIQPPKEYCQLSDLISYLLFKADFKLLKVMSHQVFCGRKKLINLVRSLEEKYGKKKKELGYEVSITNIQNFNFLQDISMWNQSRGYKSSITEDRFIRQVSTFPDRYFVISVHQNGKIVGHAVAVKLTSDSLYYFLSGIDPKNQHSMTGELIMFNLIKLAAAQKVKFLDFGTSDLENKPNHSLIFFKGKYADEYSNKYTWQIQLT